MGENEVLVAIHIPLPNPSVKSFLRSYKQGRRRDDSKGIVSAGFHIQLEQSNSVDDQWQVTAACFSFGGMGSSTVMAKNTQQSIIGLPWTKETISQACEWILNELPLDERSVGGQPEYRYCLFHICCLFKHNHKRILTATSECHHI